MSMLATLRAQGLDLSAQIWGRSGSHLLFENLLFKQMNGCTVFVVLTCYQTNCYLRYFGDVPGTFQGRFGDVSGKNRGRFWY